MPERVLSLINASKFLAFRTWRKGILLSYWHCTAYPSPLARRCRLAWKLLLSPRFSTLFLLFAPWLLGCWGCRWRSCKTRRACNIKRVKFARRGSLECHHVLAEWNLWSNGNARSQYIYVHMHKWSWLDKLDLFLLSLDSLSNRVRIIFRIPGIIF